MLQYVLQIAIQPTNTDKLQGIAIAVPTEPDVAKRATEDSLPYPLVDLKWVGEDGASATGTMQEIAAKLGTDNLSPRDSSPDNLFKRAKVSRLSPCDHPTPVLHRS